MTMDKKRKPKKVMETIKEASQNMSKLEEHYGAPHNPRNISADYQIYNQDPIWELALMLGGLGAMCMGFIFVGFFLYSALEKMGPHV